MSNLISRKALLEELHSIIEGDADLTKDYEFMGIDDCVRSIPVAYDVDKVVEQLEDESEIYCREYGKEDELYLQIVKRKQLRKQRNFMMI